ncbi:type I restriction enzyme S subunit [Plasticicumulans lactativorans]|uniref:Type I restriction enzyme S subunit n=1 Tax=Plasticicumulans lactativorans TaxID=1133106 RepID=A0A4R2KWU4_9GAMM|nr:restriction endonuclease subunit S [Plasticicumulans lactativorans]TCO77512.1 type I restriction enzyme S subunit [Plasticicumulans lactativorans]
MDGDALPDDWRWTTLGEVADPNSRAVVTGPFGSNIGSRFFVDSGVPVIRGNNLTTDAQRFVDDGFVFVTEEKADELRNCDAIADDLVFTAAGSLGQVGLIPKTARFPRYIISNKQLRARLDRKQIDPLFAFYWFSSKKMVAYVQQRNTGSSVPLINLSVLRSLPLPLPPLPEQRAIAHILGTLDDKIELNRRMSETLEAMAHALFKSWFVDFDPVRAKMEGRAPGLPKHLAELFPARLVDSELGEIPEGWEVGSIYKIADVVYGAPFASANFNTEGRGEPLIRIRDLTNESPGVWTPEVHPKGYKVRAGDVVVGMDGEFRAYLWGGAEAWLNQRVCVFVPKGGASAAFVRNSIMEPLAQVEATETATTVIHLGKGDIDRFRVVVPKARPVAAFNEHCQPWYERIVAAKQESRNLAALRDAMLPKLISGEIRVNDAEKFVARAV